ncbi:MBL fold metallo-hydrolase RNA specificity domain-containing protein [Aristaeella hokkaidonensis]|uniref:MBL fold metallo-hydrolase n=1 Tax=Aristaeella hokkaidonensis TaxID=3046382 RepID=A0AC61N9P4_9FIRM|nr:MBL fold metallo-hydrolase [Aristaeella hokkaidonensis]QUC67998.1 MBL fold metallo-hydrolase [Aristaeella hokkaidonensis]SNT93068.1 metallo-beta-lactamase family protein [Aristaeella hokkaidonensis]
MKITFIGAAHQVTGSCTLVEWMDNRYFLVDYGMEQGENDFVMEELPVAPGQIEYVFLTHAHIDHSGMLPLLYKRGFRGTIYATAETENLCSIMLADSAHIQETDAAYETKKNLRHSGAVVEPLYTSEDAAETMDLFKPCEYGEVYMVDEGLSARFSDAGHLLGSSFVELFLEDRGERRKLVCSGDVGNLDQPIINNPQPVKEADYLLIESTYGTRIHETVNPPIPALTEILRETFGRGGSVIIPSFAVGRTQELLYFFREIKQKHLLPEFESFPVYVDSPLANEATAVFLQCSQVCLDPPTREIMAEGQNPIWFDGLYTTVSSDESKALNADKTPKVIISSGGMCEGGRIRHHLKHNLWDSRNTILFVGYQANGTLGRIIYDGAESVKILGEEIDVKARIALLQGISGHADRDGLIGWLSAFEKKPSYVFVNHGDNLSCSGFASYVQENMGLQSLAPYSGSEFDLLKGEWIRLTEPVIKKKSSASGSSTSAAKDKKNKAYTDLRVAVSALERYTEQLKGHANSEIKQLTKKILDLMKNK